MAAAAFRGIGSYPSAPMPARQQYRLRARSDREIIREVEPGKRYVDRETGEEFKVVGAVLPLAPSPEQPPLRGREPAPVRVLARAAGPEGPERLPALRPAAAGRRALIARLARAGAAGLALARRLRRRPTSPRRSARQAARADDPRDGPAARADETTPTTETTPPRRPAATTAPDPRRRLRGHAAERHAAAGGQPGGEVRDLLQRQPGRLRARRAADGSS